MQCKVDNKAGRNNDAGVYIKGARIERKEKNNQEINRDLLKCINIHICIHTYTYAYKKKFKFCYPLTGTMPLIDITDF